MSLVVRSEIYPRTTVGIIYILGFHFSHRTIAKFLLVRDSTLLVKRSFSCQNPAENENMKIQCHLNDSSYAVGKNKITEFETRPTCHRHESNNF